MGLRTIAGQIKTGLALKRASDQFEKDQKEQTMNPNYDWTKSLKAGVLQILTLILSAVITAAIGVLSDSETIKAALLGAGVKEAYVTVLLFVIAGLARVLQNYRKHNPPTPTSTNAAPLILLLALASPVMAQEPAPTPANTLRLSSGATRFFSPGIGDTTEIEGQIAVEIKAPSAFVVEGFGRFTRTQGTEPRQGLLDINTFRSIVAHVAIRREVAPHFEGVCSSGVSWSRDKAFDPQEPNVWAVGCGARGSLKGKGSLSVKLGHNGSVGGLGVFGELVINQGPGIRYLATYAVPFDAARFRRNPGTFTGGVQVDVWTRGF